MAEITITPDAIKNADSYLQLALKTALAQQIAPDCLLKTEIAVKGDEKGEISPMPPRYSENALRKAQYLMGILAYMYLKNAPEKENEILMPLDEYDRWGASHVFNQIERLKRNSAVADKVFDLLADYRATEKMLNAEIYALLQTKNDPCTRLMSMFDMQTTPETLQSALAQMTQLTKDIEAQKEIHETVINGTDDEVDALGLEG